MWDAATADPLAATMADLLAVMSAVQSVVQSGFPFHRI